MTQYITVLKKTITERSAKAVEVKKNGEEFSAILVRENGKYFAYKNLCQHLPIPLDLNGGDLLTKDRRFLKCSMHGARYELATGICVSGPCEGASLIQLELTEDSTYLRVKVP